ncbi:MAG: hypothetical protein AB1813_28435 [Verrucomicrobiota bacterium]
MATVAFDPGALAMCAFNSAGKRWTIGLSGSSKVSPSGRLFAGRAEAAECALGSLGCGEAVDDFGTRSSEGPNNFFKNVNIGQARAALQKASQSSTQFAIVAPRIIVRNRESSANRSE